MSDNGSPGYTLPPLGLNPSTTAAGTTPGSFAKRGQIAPGVEGKWTFASPDTPGMPQPSEKTAWDFLPEGWKTSVLSHAEAPLEYRDGATSVVFVQSDQSLRKVQFPGSFRPKHAVPPSIC